jgi:hypothetical protein
VSPAWVCLSTLGEVFARLLQLPSGQAVSTGALSRLLLVAPGRFDMRMLGMFLGLSCAGRLVSEDTGGVTEAWLMSCIQREAYSMLLQLPGAAEVS